MPSGPKKRKAARKKKKLEEKLAFEDKSQDVISISTSSNADKEEVDSLGGNFGTLVKLELEVVSGKESVENKGTQANVDSDAEESSNVNDETALQNLDVSERQIPISKTDVQSAEDATAQVNVKLTHENPVQDESSKNSKFDAAETFDSNPDGTDENSKPKTYVESAEDANAPAIIEVIQENPDGKLSDSTSTLLIQEDKDDKGSFKTPSFNQEIPEIDDQAEESMVATKSAVNKDELEQIVVQISAINVKLNCSLKMLEEVKKIMEEVALANDEQRITLKKLLP